jgi:transcriptional regulator with XRE-family HTH domain
MPMAGKRPSAFEEPSGYELRERVRRWVRYFYGLQEPQGVSRKEFAQSLGFSAATISNVLNGIANPGIDMLTRLHFRLGADLRQMIREEPAASTGDPQPDRLPSTETKVRTKK